MTTVDPESSAAPRTLPERARVVVIGGGNIGASVLYHLAKEGWTDTVLLEKAELTSGATWHAAGLVSRMVGGYNLGSWHDYAIDLYRSMEAETDQAVGLHTCGSLRVATSPEHVDWIRHLYDGVVARGNDAYLVSPDEVAILNPLYDVAAAGVLEAIYTPDDGHVDPASVCIAMAKGARQLGATVIRNCRAVDVTLLADGSWRIDTELGSVVAEHVVNAGGYHARQIGAFSGLDLPIVPMMHHYVVTDDVPEFIDMEAEIPVTRDDYFCGYLRREQTSALIGLYDKQDPQAVWLDGCPWESVSELFEPNWEGISPWLEHCFERFPSLADLGIKHVVNGGITYTPDGAMMLGPAPGLRNYWLACGTTVGIAWGPGAGRTLAQWMVHGAADMSTRMWDPRRFGVWADHDFAIARAKEDYTLRQAMPFPQHQRHAGRNIKLSGAHARTAALGAVFEEAGGWERPRFFDVDSIGGVEPFGWRRTAVFDAVQAEARGVAERVGLGDFSAFAKFEVTGPGAHAFLERVCANRMPRDVGRTALTLLLNERGTIEGEATVVRTAVDRFWFVTGAPSERRVWDLLSHQLPAADGDREGQVELVNRTDEFGVLTLAGPRAREVLRETTTLDLSDEALPWMRAAETEIAGARAVVVRLSFTGRLAWEIHAPNDGLGDVWDALWNAGVPHGITAFGSKAIDVLRMEKAFRSAHEISNDVSPFEVGLIRMVKPEPAFTGQSALDQRIARGGGRTRATYVEVHSPDVDPLGGEAVMHGERAVGTLTSVARSPNFNRTFAFVFVPPELTEPGTELSISLFGEPVRATVLAEPAFDATNDVVAGRVP